MRGLDLADPLADAPISPAEPLSYRSPAVSLP